MGKAKINISKAIEMRVGGATLREIGEHFSTSAEAVRQAFQRAEKRNKQEKKLARLLVAVSSSEKDSVKSPVDIKKSIDDWTAILEAAKKGIELESEVDILKARLAQIEEALSLPEEKKVEGEQKT